MKSLRFAACYPLRALCLLSCCRDIGEPGPPGISPGHPLHPAALPARQRTALALARDLARDGAGAREVRQYSSFRHYCWAPL